MVKNHVERTYGATRTEKVAPYDTYTINPAISREWSVSENWDFTVKNYFLIFFRWLMVKLGLLVPFSYTKEVEVESVLQRLDGQIRMHLQKYGVEPAVVFLGPKQESELRREVRATLMPYQTSDEALRVQFRVERWAQAIRTTNHAIASMRGKQQFVNELVKKFGPWVQTFVAEDADFSSVTKFQGGTVLGVDYVTLPWIDGIVVVPRIQGFGHDRRSDLMEQMGAFR